jgi:hypothetical protein
VAKKGSRWYAVIYEGTDPVSGKERRSWHPAGRDRADAERLASRLASVRDGAGDEARSLTLGAFLSSRWLPGKRLFLAASTHNGASRRPGACSPTAEANPSIPTPARRPSSASPHAPGVPVIRLHELRHPHGTLLIAAGVPVKVVSERLGHATPVFTIETYQQVLPGMQADAARVFERLVASGPHRSTTCRRSR